MSIGELLSIRLEVLLLTPTKRSNRARPQAPTTALLVLLVSMLLIGMLLSTWPIRHFASTLVCTTILAAIASLAAVNVYRIFLGSK